MADGGSEGNDPRDSGKPEGLSAAHLYALSNAIRREILRQLHKADDARSAVGLSETMGVEGTTISYHLRVLQRTGLVLLKNGWSGGDFREKFFVSTVADDEPVLATLAKTEKEDHSACR